MHCCKEKPPWRGIDHTSVQGVEEASHLCRSSVSNWSTISSFDYEGVCASLRCNSVDVAGVFILAHPQQAVSMGYGFKTFFSGN